MKFIPLALDGAYLIEPDLKNDERGCFSRMYCRNVFEEKGLNSHLEQCNLSFNHKAGTLRGMHRQKDPCAEVKLVRCTQGKIYDVILDMRPNSPTYKKWVAATLTPENRHMLYIPEGFAHGYLTLEDNTEVFYQVSRPYAPNHCVDVRWNDPAFGIDWPLEVRVISQKDQQCPDFHD